MFETAQALAAVRRLIVLVPPADMDEVEMARRIWELAAPAGLGVLFLGLCTQIAQEPAMQRRLVTLASLTRDARIPLDTRLESGRGWLSQIKAIQRPGDVIVCHIEQRVGMRRQPLARLIAARGAPVWTLSGFYTAGDLPGAGPLTTLVFWAVSLAVLAGFFWLQVRLVRMQEDWEHSLLLYLSVLAEAGLLWAWQHFSS